MVTNLHDGAGVSNSFSRNLQIFFVAASCSLCLDGRMENNAPSLIKKWLDTEERPASWLASKIPVSRSAVSLWLKEKQIPKRAMRQRLQEVTGLPVADERAWL